MSPNLKAFLDTIAISEGTYGKGEDGYNVLWGGGLFHNGYEDHPRIAGTYTMKGKKLTSTAAGRYQILAKNYDYYKRELGLSNFSPRSQDLIAIQLIRECKALNDIEAGRITLALDKCKSRWASLPGAGYGQHEQTLQKLLASYQMVGGKFTA